MMEARICRIAGDLSVFRDGRSMAREILDALANSFFRILLQRNSYIRLFWWIEWYTEKMPTLVIHTHCNIVYWHLQVTLNLKLLGVLYTPKYPTLPFMFHYNLKVHFKSWLKFLLLKYACIVGNLFFVSKMGTKLYSTVTLWFKTITMKF